jgi:hypothetical protein
MEPTIYVIFGWDGHIRCRITDYLISEVGVSREFITEREFTNLEQFQAWIVDASGLGYYTAKRAGRQNW